MTDTVTLYRADDGWRWRYEASGRTLADSGQGYSRRIDAVKGACRVVGLQGPGVAAIAGVLREFGRAEIKRDLFVSSVAFVIEATR